MDASRIPTRFAAWSSDGRMTSLVADGLPSWPDNDDLSALEDADLAVYETALLEEVERLAADPAGDLDLVETHTNHIEALRAEAARRMAAGGDVPDAGDGGAAPDPAEAEARSARLAAINARLHPEPAEPPAPVLSTDPEAAPTMSAADIAAAVTAGVTAGVAPLAEAVTAAASAMVAPAAGTPLHARPRAGDIGGYLPDALAPIAPAASSATRVPAQLIANANVPGFAAGSPITTVSELAKAFISRHEATGRGSGVEDEKVVVASLVLERDKIPAERDIRGLEWDRAREKALSVMGLGQPGVDPWNPDRELPIGRGGIVRDSAIVASGGLSAPVEPYYPQLVIAQGGRPVKAALPGFIADRGGIRLVLPPHLGDLTLSARPGQFADGVTNTDTSFTSATAAFTAADVGKPIYQVNSAGNVVTSVIPAGTVISTVTNGTTVVLSQATLATGTGLAFYLPGRNPNNLGSAVGLVSAAQDAAGPPTVVKYTYDVPLGTQAEFDVYSIYDSLQFANLTARTFPEQVEANIRLADAVHARVAETQMLDVISLWSTLFTAAKTFGSARQLFAQWEHMAAYYRGHNRMDPAAVLRLGVPFWTINLCRADYLSTFIGGGAANWGLSDDEINAWFQDRRIMPFFYQDGPSDVSQLFANPPSNATGNGTTLGTPTALPDYPGSGATSSFRTKVVSFMWAEGTWLGLSTGELNVGLVRDSILNSQNRFRNFQEEFETPAFVGVESLRCVHTVASDGTYGAAAAITLGAGSGL